MTFLTAQWPRRIREILDRFGLYAPADGEQNAGFREDIMNGVRIWHQTRTFHSVQDHPGA